MTRFAALGRSVRLPLLALGAGLAVSATMIEAPRAALACASAPPRGAEVGIAAEEAVIVWDAKSGTEHFIRTASFVSSATSFGFLVPTPSIPDLGEMPRAVLDGIDDALQPAVQRVDEPTRWVLTSLLSFFLRGEPKSGAASAAAAATDDVQIVGVSSVAGMDATILKATDVDALAKWLADHGFDRSKQLDDWLARYVEDHWYVTAFVISSGPESKGAASSAGGPAAPQVEVASRLVRMSFHADAPFYPYREPAVQPSADPGKTKSQRRRLRVHVLSDQRMSAKTNGAPWSASTTWAGEIQLPQDLRALAAGNVYDTTFFDASSPRVGTDEVTFAPSDDQSEVHPPPHVVRVPHLVRLPIELFVLGGGLLGVLAYALLRRKKA